MLDRLRRLRTLLTSLDAAEDQTVERVQLAVEELERIRRELAGIKPPETLRSQHDMLLQATTLALMATRLRVDAFQTSDAATRQELGVRPRRFRLSPEAFYLPPTMRRPCGDTGVTGGVRLLWLIVKAWVPMLIVPVREPVPVLGCTV